MIRLFLLFMMLVYFQVPAQKWHDDLEKALDLASKENRKVLLYFSIDQGCNSCQDLQRGVFESEDFARFAVDYVLVRENFGNERRRTDKAAKLLIVEKYNKDGFFPYVLVLDKEGKVLKKTGASGTENPTVFLAALKN
jgi:thioredoxin-related protein